MKSELIAGYLEKVECRYYGKYRGFVSDNADPENRGRLRLRIPAALGDDVVSGWALPCAPYGGASGVGFFYIPDKDAGVWVEFEQGQLDYPVWVGTFWAKPGGTTEVPSPTSSQSPPTAKMIKTKNHTIQLEDASGSEAITISDGANSNKVVMDSNGITIQMKDESNEVVLTSSGIALVSKAVMIGSDSASQPLVLGTQLLTALTNLLTYLTSHTHTGNLGAPTSPPLIPPNASVDFSQINSKKHITE